MYIVRVRATLIGVLEITDDGAGVVDPPGVSRTGSAAWTKPERELVTHLKGLKRSAGF